ncbi:MAG: bifunctional oligoribonuclease/PAP phosphatase NrnA [Halobacteriales archaeon]
MPRGSAAALEQMLDRAIAAARAEPLVAVGALALVVAIIVTIGLVIRWLRRSTGEQFRRSLAEVDTVAILMHPNPDPDAMAAAIGVRHIAEGAGTDATIYYSGQIRHQENRAFQTVLNLSFEQIETASDLGGDPVILVDHNEPRGFSGAGGYEPFAVIDHHPGNGVGEEFTDVRPEYGACASLIAEYLRDLGAEPLPPETIPEEANDAGIPDWTREIRNQTTDGVTDSNGDGIEEVAVRTDGGGLALPPSIATGLLYGILADTTNLTRGCSDAEFEASSYLYPAIDEELIDRIANPQVDAEILDVIAEAITNRVVKGSFAISDVGSVSNLDAIPQAADELLQLEGVTAVVIMGAKEGTLHLSGRSRDDRVHMGQVLQTAVADIPMADAGGHARMGGGQLSIRHMEGIGPGAGLTREKFRERLFDAMAGDI